MLSFPYLFVIQRGLSSAIFGHRLRSSAAPGGWTSARRRRGAPGGGCRGPAAKRVTSRSYQVVKPVLPPGNPWFINMLVII